MTLKLIWLTDLHLLPPGQALGNYDTIQRLELAVAYIKQQHADADYCVLSGDLTNKGDASCYELLHEIMSDAGLRYLPLTGNHDSREALLANLTLPNPEQHHVSDNFVQYAITLNGYRLIALDTLLPGSSEGLLCSARLDWLRAELERDTLIPTLIFCHHPPAKLHLPLLDDSHMRDGDAFLELLCTYSNIQHLCFGHVHRPVSGTFRQIGFTAMRATSMQAPLPYPPWTWDTFTPATEAPALGIVLCSKDSVVIHAHAYCDASDGYFD